MTSPPKDSIRFGPFELNRDASQLLKDGVRVKLSQQPLQLLATLLERPGDVISREELRQRLWSSDVFVDFDRGLNKNILKLREALDDSAGSPEYIETVPRVGYRFIGLVVEEFPASAQHSEAAERAWRPVAFRSLLTAGIVLLILGTWIWFRQGKRSSPEKANLITSFGFDPALSHDGKLLAYVSDPGNGTAQILVRQTAGGETVPVTSDAFLNYSPQFSPDGTRIVYTSSRGGGGLYSTPTLGGGGKVLVDNPRATFPRFIGSGDKLVYFQDGQLFSVSSEGGPSVALPVSRDFHAYGRLFTSPNGKLVLFYGKPVNQQNDEGAWWTAPLESVQASKLDLPGIEQNTDPSIAVRAWVRTSDNSEWIVYSTGDAENWVLWRVRVSSNGAAEGIPELVTSGHGILNPGVSASDDGRLVYSTSSVMMAIYQMTTSERGEKLGPTLQLPLPEGGTYASPSVSWDGRKLVYVNAEFSHSPRVLLRDLSTGAESIVDETGRRQGAIDYTAVISPDGSKVIFERDCKKGLFPEDHVSPLPCSFIVSSRGGEPEQICESCTPQGFSSDGSVVLFNKFDQHEGMKDRIVRLNLDQRTEQPFLSDKNKPLYNGHFSRDGRWVAFRRTALGDEPPSELLIAEIREGTAAGAANWIRVTDTKYSDDQPRFSADGNTLYFTSDRDGYLCIWAQRLNPTTKHPIGAPRAYEHFHNSSGHQSILNQRMLYLSIARDKMLVNTMQFRGELWLTAMPQAIR